MVKKIKLEVKSREEKNGKASKMRSEGLIPGVIYGPKSDNKTLKIRKIDLEKAYEKAGESSLIDLFIDGKDEGKVIIKDVQRDPVRNTISHVDFYSVDMDQKLELEIPVEIIGESKAEKELGGTLIHNLEEITVKCLPKDIIEDIKVDISVIDSFDDIIRVKDLKVPAEIEILNEPEEVVVLASEPREEEEEVVEEAEAKEGEGKKEEAEAKEGEGKKEEAEAKEGEGKKA